MTAAPLVDTGTPRPRPPYKWVGGKSQLVPAILPLLPKRFGRYFEPFLGGGAMFLAVVDRLEGPAYLADANAELVHVWKQLQTNVERVIEELRPLVYDEKLYYEIRARRPDDLSDAERAARFLYLNKTGFNGLYRVNKRGQFNVPFGKYTNPTICDAENLRAVSLAARGHRVYCADFRKVLGLAEKGDLVYFDSPYVPVSTTANFTSYTQDGFREEDHRALAKIFQELSDDGVYCVLSNSDTPLVRELYVDYPITSLSRSGAVSSKASGRGRVAEVLVRSGTW